MRPPFTLHEYVGPPQWFELDSCTQCVKYASLSFVDRLEINPSAFVGELIQKMVGLLPKGESPLVDIRYWPDLKAGDIPGVPGWHYDCYNTPDKAQDDQHVLYFYGAGCRTMFRPDIQPEEGWIIGYDHSAEHRITECTSDGPRLLVRVSQTSIKPANHVYKDAHVVRKRGI